MFLLTFNFSDILVLLFGLFVGLVWGTFIFFKRKKSLIMKRINKDFLNIDKEKQEEVNNIINNVYQYHVISRDNKREFLFGLISFDKKIDYNSLAKEKLNLENQNDMVSISHELYILINNVAAVYYPTSECPIYELSIDEILHLLREVISLCKGIIDDLGIPQIEKLTINQIREVLIFGNKVRTAYNMKGVKFTIKCFNLAIKLQSVITPIYWIKKGTKDFSISSLLQFLIKCLFEVVGKETANIYNESFKNF
jgi:hypothetical protein